VTGEKTFTSVLLYGMVIVPSLTGAICLKIIRKED
jgi:hypothetical protein